MIDHISRNSTCFVREGGKSQLLSAFKMYAEGQRVQVQGARDTANAVKAINGKLPLLPPDTPVA